MTMSRTIVAVVLVGWVGLILTGTAPAQSFSADDEAIRKLYNDFFEAFRQGGPAAAVANLRQSGSLDEDTAQALERRLQGVSFPAGRADSYTVVTEMEIPHSLRFRSLTFLTHHDTRPVAWRLRFYQKTNGVWVILNVDFELRFVEDFLRLPQLEFDAHRAQIELAARARDGGEERRRR